MESVYDAATKPAPKPDAPQSVRRAAAPARGQRPKSLTEVNQARRLQESEFGQSSPDPAIRAAARIPLVRTGDFTAIPVRADGEPIRPSQVARPDQGHGGDPEIMAGVRSPAAHTAVPPAVGRAAIETVRALLPAGAAVRSAGRVATAPIGRAALATPALVPQASAAAPASPAAAAGAAGTSERAPASRQRGAQNAATAQPAGHWTSVSSPCRPSRPCHHPAASQGPSSPASRRPSPRWSPIGQQPKRHPATPSAQPWSGQRFRP